MSLLDRSSYSSLLFYSLYTQQEIVHTTKDLLYTLRPVNDVTEGSTHGLEKLQAWFEFPHYLVLLILVHTICSASTIVASIVLAVFFIIFPMRICSQSWTKYFLVLFL